jgi:Kdo2-lipid IVA lauroyltransferase/acyltransferase
MKKTAASTLILSLFRIIPLWLRRRLFGGLFLLFYHLDTRHRMITLHNLHNAFPEKDMDEIVRLAKGSFRHIGIVLAEFFCIPDINDRNLHEWVEFEGLEHYVAARAQNRGIIASIGHFGNWELMAAAFPYVARYGAEALTKAGTPTKEQCANVIYRPLDNETVENLTSWVRTLNGAVLVPKGKTSKRAMRLLESNEMVAIASDQNVAAREGVFIDYFGRPACTAVGLAVLALRSGAPVIPAFLARIGNGRYRLVIGPAMEFALTGDYETDLKGIMQKVSRVIEDFVRLYPDQYFWMHSRWKTQSHQTD